MSDTTCTTQPDQTTRTARVAEVRDLIGSALEAYAATPDGATRMVAGLTAADLAAAVPSWTHLTRLADFIATHGSEVTA